MERASIRKNYTFLTHAGRALSLWRGEFPAESWARLTRPAAGIDANGGPEATARSVVNKQGGRSTQARRQGPPEPLTARTAAARSLWTDDRGALLSVELILLATLMVLGLIVGLTTYRDAVVQELGDTAAAVAGLTQSFGYARVAASGTFGEGASAVAYSGFAEGSRFEDKVDVCEEVLDSAGTAPLCISITAPTGDES